ncbi:MAG: chromosome segregation protein SMC, partial [Ignavibacteria bacterium]|nr:chromosome segregation protein SMC [Ignavibacteria bacterium]
KVTVDFDSGITAIVGPNGCGKTNIVDAIRWVIGEQKASVLRSATMENVIFNGTNSRKALGYAEVSLTIQNSKGILPSEYSEIKITRRCFRDGTSNYMLNGTPCHLKDIHSLFMDTGMGADAYSVIELKMVNDILSHRTQDRRKLFEEAAGITKYKERRREALNKLEAARESINEANIEIRNRQRTVNTLERLAERQREARELAEKLKELEIEYHTRYISKLSDESRYIEEDLKKMEDQRESIQIELNENEQLIEKHKSELSETENELNSYRDKLNEILIRYNETKSEISIFEQRIQHLSENIQRFTREKNDIENEIRKLQARKTEASEKISTLSNTSELMEASLNEKKLSLEGIESRVKSSKDELKDLTSKHFASSRLLTEKQNEYEILKNKLDYQLSACSKLTEENISAFEKISETENQIREISKLLNNKKEQLSGISEKHKERVILKHKLSEKITDNEKKLISIEHEIEKLSSKKEFLKALQENFEDYSEGVKYLVADRKEKGLNLVIDNLEVEDKFKLAIETALGEISNYLIVENKDKAYHFIKLLEENDKGKVTFIIKDRLYSFNLNIFQEEFPEILSYEGVYGWADRFVKCPDEYILLYKYLLDEFIIVENLEVAKKLSSGNFIKFITLDGDIVTDGFIRSGSKTPAENLKLGRQKLILETEIKIEELRKSKENLLEELESLKSEFSAIETDTTEKEIKQLESEIISLESSKEQLNYQKSQINIIADSNKKEIDDLQAENTKITESIDILISEIETAENLKYQREKELEHFTTELENLTDELTEKRKELSAYENEITKIKTERSALINELESIAENIVSRENIIKERTLECESYKREISEISEKVGKMGSDFAFTGLKATLMELNKEKESVETDYSLIKKRYDAERKLVEHLENKQKNLRTQRDELIDNIHRLDKQLTKDRMEIHEHKNRMLEEYNTEIEYKKYDNNDFFDFNKTRSDIERYKNRLRQLGGSGQGELGYYEEEKAALDKLLAEREDLLQAEKDLINLIDELNKTAQQKFTETFERIRLNFMNIFRELFMEGDEADLKLVTDQENPDPLDAKIDIIAKPRGKRPQLIDLLSGGEKTLTAIALLFAIYQEKPSPFCVLDEVDAPLDDANIDRFIKIIRKFSQDTQFIIVTHNKRTMEAADSMYGVTMAEQGVSTIVNVRFRDQKVAS